MKQSFKIVVTSIVTCVITFVLTVYFCLFSGNTSMSRLERINRIIKKDYIGEYNPETAEDQAIRAIVKSTGDKYSAYYDKGESEETMQRLEGYYIGVGIEIYVNTEKDCIEVIAAFEGSPAFKAGVKPGDVIVSIDGKKYGASDMVEASDYMRGENIEKPMEKTLKLELLRDGKTVNLTMKREKISMYKVKTEKLENDILYINYSGFTEESEKELEKVIEKAESDGIKALIIDVRNNPGGEFKSAIDMCDMFLDDGMIMYTVDNKEEKTVYNAKKGKYDFPMAVLVNGATASASEIFAGSMQSRERAVIIGEKTFGKGVSQSIIPINNFNLDGGMLKLTTCKNYTPDGKWINECIYPDIEVKNENIYTDIKEDPVLQEAVKELMKKGNKQ